MKYIHRLVARWKQLIEAIRYERSLHKNLLAPYYEFAEYGALQSFQGHGSQQVCIRLGVDGDMINEISHPPEMDISQMDDLVMSDLCQQACDELSFKVDQLELLPRLVIRLVTIVLLSVIPIYTLIRDLPWRELFQDPLTHWFVLFPIPTFLILWRWFKPLILGAIVRSFVR